VAARWRRRQREVENADPLPDAIARTHGDDLLGLGQIDPSTLTSTPSTRV